MSDNILKSIAFTLLCLAPLTLLIVAQNLYFPFITGKAIAFRLIVSVAALLVGLSVVRSNTKTFSVSRLQILVLVFLGVNLISVILSESALRGFWGNAERMEGWISLFYYALYFFALSFLLRGNPRRAEITAWLFLAVSAIEFLVAVSQLSGGGVVPSGANGRADGTFGNATYLGLFALLSIWLATFLLDRYRGKETQGILIGFIALNVASLVLSGSRGSLVGLGASVIAFLVIFLLRPDANSKPAHNSPSFQNKKIVAGALLLLVVCAPLILFALRGTPLMERMPLVFQRASEVFSGQDATTRTRTIVWQMFLAAFRDKPFFGWGLEASPSIFYHYFDKNLFNFEETIFDRAHNKFVEALVTTGGVGFVSYAALIGALIVSAVRRKDQRAWLVPLLAGYLGNLFFLFDFQGSWMVLAFLLAVSDSSNSELPPIKAVSRSSSSAKASADKQNERSNANEGSNGAKGMIRSVSVIAVCGAVLVLIPVHIQMYAGLGGFVKDLSLFYRTKGITVLRNASLAARGNPVFAAEFGIETGQIFLQGAQGIPAELRAEMIGGWRSTIEQNKNDFRLLAIGINMLLTEYQLTGDGAYLREAEERFAGASWISRDFPDYAFIESQILLKQGKTEEAIRRARVLAESIPGSVRVLRQAFLIAVEAESSGQSTEFLRALSARGWKPSALVEYAAVIKTYLMVGDFDRAKVLYKEVATMDEKAAEILRQQIPELNTLLGGG